MDKKQQKKLYIAGGATGLLVVILMVLAFSRWQDTAIQEDYEEKVEALKTALDPSSYSNAIYPNAKNIELVKTETESLTKLADEIENSFSILPVQLQGEFSNNSLRENITQLNNRQMPMLMSLDSTSASDVNFTQEYNFETYLSGGMPIDPAHQNRLRLQLSFIQDAVETLINVAPVVGDRNEVLVTGVKRTVFDKKTNATEEKTRSRRSSRRKKNADDVVTTFSGAPVPKDLANEVKRESFELSFRTRYSVVAKFLNALNTSKTFYVVNSVKIVPVTTLEKEVEAKQANVKKTSARRSSRRNKDVAGESETPIVEGLANRLVPNPKTASLVDATISFDVYYTEKEEESEGK